MSNAQDFFVRFWGVRGSISTSDSRTCRYGGNTSCLEIRCGERLLIFDAGTGVRYLGNMLCKTGRPIDADIFLTHTHYDHVCGIPFFVPFFVPGNRFRMRAGHLLPKTDIHSVLCELMKSPLFPVPPEIFQSHIEFHDFMPGDVLAPNDSIVVRTCPLNHPNGAIGYRVEFGGKSICYLTDTEHKADGPDANIVELIRGCDIAIYDSMYTQAEYESRVGWGHSTWEAGVELCDAADVGRLVIFHHDPEHDDAFMDRIGAEAAARRPGTIVAQEGMVLHP